ARLRQCPAEEPEAVLLREAAEALKRRPVDRLGDASLLLLGAHEAHVLGERDELRAEPRRVGDEGFCLAERGLDVVRRRELTNRGEITGHESNDFHNPRGSSKWKGRGRGASVHAFMACEKVDPLPIFPELERRSLNLS